jgi:hypothetical protein
MKHRYRRPDQPSQRPLVADECRPHKPSVDLSECVVRSQEPRVELTDGFVRAAVDDSPSEYVIRRVSRPEPKSENNAPADEHEPLHRRWRTLPCGPRPLLCRSVIAGSDRHFVCAREVVLPGHGGRTRRRRRRPCRGGSVRHSTRVALWVGSAQTVATCLWTIARNRSSHRAWRTTGTEPGRSSPAPNSVLIGALSAHWCVVSHQ